MLAELCIINFALIDRLELTFGPGFNVLTGETGAGKSIIIGALNLILGGRAAAEMIRDGSQEAEVQAVFSPTNSDTLNEQLEQFGLPTGDDLLIRRIINRTGRNRIYINGVLSTLNQLSLIAGELVNISGQHEHQRLLEADQQLMLLDRFGGLMPFRTKMALASSELAKLTSQFSQLGKKIKTAQEKNELLDFQAKEIEDAAITLGEDNKLEQERLLIRNAEDIYQKVADSHERLYAQAGSVSEILDMVRTDLAKAAKLDSRLEQQARQIEDSYHQLTDAAMELNHHLSRLTFDPERMEEVEDRLALLGRLKKKYGPALAQVLEHGTKAEGLLKELEEMKREQENLSTRIDKARAKSIETAGQMAKKRKAEAKKMSAAVADELRGLGMPHLEFEVSITSQTDSTPGPTGWDEVEFLISPNLGEDLKALSRIASGGELSRTLLGIKALMAGKEGVQTLVFDEVDAGIGGGTASVVGSKIAALAGYHQVLCITHMPQIAAYAQHHHRVYKEIKGQRTVTGIEPISDKHRAEEIARMIGGKSFSEKTLSAAKELMAQVDHQ